MNEAFYQKHFAGIGRANPGIGFAGVLALRSDRNLPQRNLYYGDDWKRDLHPETTDARTGP